MRLFLLCILGFSLTSVHAEVFKGPISSALGGAGSAGIQGAESGFVNPALIGLHKGSGIDAYYRDGQVDRGRHRQTAGLGAIDNSYDVWFPGAIHYLLLRETGKTPTPANGELWHVAISEQRDQLALGISAYRLVYKVENDRDYTQWNGSVGAVYMFTEAVGVAYVLKNIAGPGSEVPVGLREDMQQTAGVLVGFDMARLRFDISRQERFNPDKKMAYMLGLETKTGDLVIMRMGYRLDDLAGQHVWTAGFGFDGPRLRLDYAFEKTQERTSGALHSVDLRLLF